MGIELPTPHGEALTGPLGGTERPHDLPSGEHMPTTNNVERNATERPASQETRTGQGSGDGNGSSAANDANASTVTIARQAAPAATISLDDVPVVAADEDLIEKQWVDSAKRIIKETRNDPFMQGEAIGRLQADYLQKRYGKSLTDSGA